MSILSSLILAPIAIWAIAALLGLNASAGEGDAPGDASDGDGGDD
jgi:hypothetical protein